MKYIITESQWVKLSDLNMNHLKKPMFRYWDIKGPKNYRTAMKFFSIPPAGSTLVLDWLLEWMGGENELRKILNRFSGKVMNVQVGTYDFNFYISKPTIYVHHGIEIYFDATVDGDGKIEVNLDNGDVLYNIHDAHLEEDIGWEVDSEIRDSIVETLEKVIDIEFDMHIDRLIITEPGKFKN